MLKITISILIGTCLGLYTDIALLFFLLIFICFFKCKREYKICLLIIVIVFIRVQYIQFKYEEVGRVIENLGDGNFNIIATVVSNKEENEYKNKYIIKINKWDFKYKNLKFILYTDKNIELEYGDIIQINTTIENATTSRNYKGFDYKRYLRQNKIYGICNSIDVYVIDKENINFCNYIFKLKTKSSNILEENFNEKESSFLKGILLGDTNNILSEDKKAFQKSNLAHILAISGMHVSYIIIAVNFVLDKIIFSKKIKNYLMILFLIFFVIFTGSSVSCIRAVIMMILIIISKNIYRLSDFYSNLFFSFCFILIYNPYNIESVGMWLSFLGTVGLVVFRREIKISLNVKILNKIVNYILNSLYTSFSVQILIFPIIIYCYNSISLTFFISNLLVSFFIGPVLILGYMSIFMYKFKLLIIIEDVLIKLIMKIALLISDLKISSILIGTPKLIILIIYYIILIVLINRKTIFNKLQKIRLYIKLVKIYKLNKFKILIIILFLIIFIFSNYFVKDNIKIHFLDVGQGDCTFIILPNGKNLLIDGGDRTENFDYGEKVVGPYLLDKNIRKIDYMIISHFDSDHVGGLIYIAQNFEIKNILIGIQFEKNDNLNKILKIIQEKNINLMALEQGNRVKLDKEIYMDVLFPIKNNKIENNSINNNSLVFKLILKDIKILFTGDIEEEAEKKLVNLYGQNLKCDILKVAHHGSGTSSTDTFLKYANPQIALIGVRSKQ